MGLPTRKSNPTSAKAKKILTKSSSKLNNTSATKVVVKPVVINVFFDGTKNNLYNIDASKQQKYQDAIAKDKDAYESYTNAYSNVAHLFTKRYDESKDNVWVYVEGIGTEKYEADSKAGFAYGSGATGVKARAESAFAAIQTKYSFLTKSSAPPSSLVLNVFGFSRGAATARHFVHLAKNQPKLFKDWGLSAKQIRFRFIGIFDTVSSFQTIDFIALAKAAVFGVTGVAQTAVQPNFSNDVKELNLNFSDFDDYDKKVTKIFHIAAADEYRKYFDLTDISSAIKGKFGFEVVMNGAHSDIGGSYPNNMTDNYHITSEELKTWFLDQGFYTSDEIKSVGKNEYHAIRKAPIPYEYHKISLRIMRLMTQTYGLLKFSQGIVDYENKNLKGIVKELMNQHPSTVMKNVNWGRRMDICLKDRIAADKKRVQNLRNQFLHWSAKKTYQGSLTQDLGYEIRLKNGLPYREIHHG